jgi:preprotein translocase subunit SecE
MGRIAQFIRDVRGEISKIVWPTRQEVIRFTIAVIVFSGSVSLLLGAFDYGLLKGFEAILNK